MRSSYSLSIAWPSLVGRRVFQGLLSVERKRKTWNERGWTEILSQIQDREHLLNARYLFGKISARSSFVGIKCFSPIKGYISDSKSYAILVQPDWPIKLEQDQVASPLSHRIWHLLAEKIWRENMKRCWVPIQDPLELQAVSIQGGNDKIAISP